MPIFRSLASILKSIFLLFLLRHGGQICHSIAAETWSGPARCPSTARGRPRRSVLAISVPENESAQCHRDITGFLVLRRNGKNAFVCSVRRSWTGFPVSQLVDRTGIPPCPDAVAGEAFRSRQRMSRYCASLHKRRAWSCCLDRDHARTRQSRYDHAYAAELFSRSDDSEREELHVRPVRNTPCRSGKLAATV